MMPPNEPSQGFRSRRHGGPRREQRPIDHHDRKPKLAGRLDFGKGSAAARIFRQHDLYVMLAKKLDVAFGGEWPPGLNYSKPWQTYRVGGQIDQADDVSVMWSGAQFFQREPTDGTKDPAFRFTKRAHAGSDIRHFDPIIAFLSLPGGPVNSEQRYSRGRGGFNCVSAHLARKGMGCVHQSIDALFVQIPHEAVDAAEPAAAYWQRVSHWRCRSAGKRKHGLKPPIGSKRFCKGAGFRRAPEEKNAHASRQ